MIIQLKMGKRLGYTLSQSGYSNGQQIHAKVPNITNDQGNVHHTQNEISHACYNGYYQKT